MNIGELKKLIAQWEKGGYVNDATLVKTSWTDHEVCGPPGQITYYYDIKPKTEEVWKAGESSIVVVMNG